MLHLVGIYMTSITKMHGTMNIKYILITYFFLFLLFFGQQELTWNCARM